MFISQHFLQPAIIISGLWLIREKVEDYVYFRKPLWPCSFYRTELVSIMFFEKYCVKCTNALTEIPLFHGNKHSEITFTFSKILKCSAVSKSSIVNLLEEQL